MRSGARLATRIKAMETKQRGRGCPACGGGGVYCVLEAKDGSPFPSPAGCARCGRVKKLALIRLPAPDAPPG